MYVLGASDQLVYAAYNFPQGRLTDHRINLTLYKLENVMNGELDEIIDGLVTADQAQRLRQSEG